MIYDCFTFFNELDLLEIRLNYLNDVVDKFVLVEMAKTHSNKEKPLYFAKNKARYKQFLDKIIYVEAKYSGEENPDSWLLENFQRDCIMQGLEKAKNDDVVIISDLDEIPSRDVIKNYKSGIVVPQLRMMYYYLNCMNTTDSIWTNGTRIGHLSDLKNPNQDMTHMFGARYTKQGTPTNFRFCSGEYAANGGWHFSYLGGTDAIKCKLESFAHQEFNKPNFRNKRTLEARIRKGEDIFGRNYKYKAVPHDETFPEYILKNRKKYKHLILDEK